MSYWSLNRVHDVQYKTVQPASDRVLVKLAKSQEVTASGILLPSAAQTKDSEGEIASIGKVEGLKVRTALHLGFHTCCTAHAAPALRKQAQQPERNNESRVLEQSFAILPGGIYLLEGGGEAPGASCARLKPPCWWAAILLTIPACSEVELGATS